MFGHGQGGAEVAGRFSHSGLFDLAISCQAVALTNDPLNFPAKAKMF